MSGAEGSPSPAAEGSGGQSATAKGRCGERRAGEYLRRCGYQILEINFRSRVGEVDIIGTRRDTVVFFEVKTWSAVPWSELGYSISERKKRRLTAAAKLYLAETARSREHCRIRFDLLLVSPTEGVVRHIENAFA